MTVTLDVPTLDDVLAVTPELRILVTIARDWKIRSAVYSELHGLHARCRREGLHLVLTHGACPEGDQMVTDWAGRFGDDLVTEDPHPADWDHCGPECPPWPHRITKRPDDVVHPGDKPDFCPGAGPRRNRAMVALGAHACRAFITPRSKGARGTADLAEAAGIPVRRIRPDGSDPRGGGR